MKALLMKVVLALVLLQTASAHAELQAVSDDELSQVAGAAVVDRATMLRQSLTEYIRQRADQVSQQDIEKFLRQRAEIFGLSLNNIKIEGVTYDGSSELILQLDGVTVSTQQLPSHIDLISIPSITVHGSSPANKSFGSVDIKDISLSGTRIWINSSSVPGAVRAIPNMNNR